MRAQLVVLCIVAIAAVLGIALSDEPIGQVYADSGSSTPALSTETPAPTRPTTEQTTPPTLPTTAGTIPGLVTFTPTFSPTNTCTPTVTPTPRPNYLPLVMKQIHHLCNGGFESGRIGPCWFDAGRLPRSVVPDVKRSGQYALQLGNPLYQDRGGCPVGEAAVYQLADVPASGHAQLHVWYRIFSNDTVDFDYFGISTAAWPEGEMELRHHDGCTNWTGTLWDSGWREAVITLDNYREQTIIVKLYNAMTNADGWYNTWTVVDDVRVVWVP